MKKWIKVAGVLYICEHGFCKMAHKVLDDRQFEELSKIAKDKNEGILEEGVDKTCIGMIQLR